MDDYDALDEFSQNMAVYYGLRCSSSRRTTLTAVTAENAGQFSPAPKRRGPPAKVRLSGNVVAFRRLVAPEPTREEGIRHA
jgi:hypothetical protein